MRHGFLLIDKPEGPTSHDAVATVRRVLHEPKAGHLGTLDPAASGLLVVAVGAKALKVIELFGDLSKEYEAHIRFGSVSTTYDREGVLDVVPPKPGWSPPDRVPLRRIIDERFIGRIQQVPPAHSAVHIDGKRAYDLAREGVDMPMLAARVVDIHACEILSYEYPDLVLRVACGSGTYIRSLAHDLGTVLGCGGYLAGLRRTMVGDWSLADAVEPDDADWVRVLPLKEVLASFGGLEVTDDEAKALAHGQGIAHEIKPDTLAWHQGLPIAILTPMRDGTQRCRARKVF